MTEKTRTALQADLDSDIDSNGVGGITGAILNARLTDITDSMILDEDGPVVAVASRTAMSALTATAGDAVYLCEAGREGVFVFDDSDLSTEVTADTAEGIYVAPDSDTDGSSGAWVRQFQGAASVRWFGATGDGSTDDGPALAAACSMPDISLFVPAGIYSCESDLAVDFDDVDWFALKGEGEALSTIVYDGSGTLLTISLSANPPQTKRGYLIDGLTFKTATHNTGTAIDVDFPDAYAPGSRFAHVITNCRFGHESAGWAFGIRLSAPTFGVFKNLKGLSDSQEGVFIEVTGGSPSNGVDNHFDGIHAFECDVAMHFDSATAEGFYVSNFTAVNVNRGIVWEDTTSADPLLALTNAHIAAIEYGVLVDGAGQCLFNNALIYATTSGGCGLALMNTGAISGAGNHMVSGIHIQGSTGTVGVQIGADVSVVTLGDGRVNGAAQGLVIASGASGVRVGGMFDIRNSATPITDAGTGTYYEYRAGSITPTVVGTSTAGTASYSFQDGGYVRQGNLVSFWLRVIYSSHTGTGNLRINGLPFTVNGSITVHQGVGSLTYSNDLKALAVNGTTQVALQTYASGGSAADVPMDAGADIAISGQYFVA